MARPQGLGSWELPELSVVSVTHHSLRAEEQESLQGSRPSWLVGGRKELLLLLMK